jgi:large subunit ribosomal protein L29
MKARDVRRRDSADLEQEVRRLEEAVFQRRFHGASEEKADRGLIRKSRKDIARIKTVLRARAQGRETAPVAGSRAKEAK